VGFREAFIEQVLMKVRQAQSITVEMLSAFHGTDFQVWPVNLSANSVALDIDHPVVERQIVGDYRVGFRDYSLNSVQMGAEWFLVFNHTCIYASYINNFFGNRNRWTAHEVHLFNDSPIFLYKEAAELEYMRLMFFVNQRIVD
jgi:hypothetical protein